MIMLELVKRVFRQMFQPAPRKPLRNRRLEIEVLEDRTAPALYVWNPVFGAANFNASNVNNWSDGVNRQYVQGQDPPPGPTSQLRFSGDNSSECTFDAASNATFASIEIPLEYLGNITLTHDVTFSGVLNNNPVTSGVSSSRIRGQAANQPVTYMSFYGSVTISGLVTNVGLENYGTMTISSTFMLRDSFLNNFGTVNWGSAADINLNAGSIYNTTAGAFNMTSTGVMRDVGVRPLVVEGPPAVQFWNAGILTKSGNGTTQMNVRSFRNFGEFDISGGTLTLNSVDMLQEEGKTWVSLLAAQLELRSGNAAGTYYVLGGRLRGTGTIQGNVSMQSPQGMDLPTGPVLVVPDLLLTIEGNLTLSASTTVAVPTDANATPWIAVLPNNAGQGGRIDFNNCRIDVARAAGFTPAFRTTIDIVTSSSSTGQFRATFPALRLLPLGWVPNAWTDANAVPVRFAVVSERVAPAAGAVWGRTRVFLRVERRPGAGAAIAAGANDLLAVFDNDPDFNGATSVVAVNGVSSNVGQAITTANGGSFMALSDGSFDYVPPDNFYGPDSVDYTVSDGTTYKDATITFYVPRTDPYTLDAEFGLIHDTTFAVVPDDYSFGLFDYAVNFDPANLAVTEVNGETSNVGVQISTTNDGLVTVNADGSFTYQAPPAFVGQDFFNVTVFDGVASGTISVTLDVTNVAPTAVDLSYATLHDQSLSITASQFPYGLLPAPYDEDGDPLPIVAVNNDTSAVGNASATALNGYVTVHADGSFDYVPPTGTTGDDTFTCTISDGIATSTATVTIHVTATAPSVDDAFYSVLHGAFLSVPYGNVGGLLSWASDPDLDPLEVAAVNGEGFDTAITTFTDQGGVVNVGSDGSFTYTPPAHWNGDDSFTFTVMDMVTLATVSATATIHVTNELPSASDAEYSSLQDQLLSVPYSNVGGLLSWTSDPDNDPLVIVAIDGDPDAVGTEITTANGGVIIIGSDGSFAYTPPTGWTGDETLTFTIADGIATATATLTIHVLAS